MSLSRHREVANSRIDAPEYLGFLQKWFQGYDGPWPGLETMFESCRASSVRQVTPVAVVRISGLLGILLSGGVSNCVVYPSKWEAAGVAFAGHADIMCRPDCRQVGGSFATHAYGCLSWLRVFIQEDTRLSRGIFSRKFSMSSPFRKSMGFSEGEIVRSLASKVKVVAEGSPSRCLKPSFSCVLSPQPHLDDPRTSAPELPPLEFDVDGFPIIFAKSLPAPTSTWKASSRESSIAPTEAYDEEGFPRIDFAAMEVVEPPEKQEESRSWAYNDHDDTDEQVVEPLKKQEEEVPIISPKPHKRHAQVLRNCRHGMKRPATSTVKQQTSSSAKQPVSMKIANDIILRFAFASARDGRFEVTANSATNKRIYIGTLKNITVSNTIEIKSALQELIALKAIAADAAQKLSEFKQKFRSA